MVQDSVTSAEPSDHLQNLFLVLMSGCGRVFYSANHYRRKKDVNRIFLKESRSQVIMCPEAGTEAERGPEQPGMAASVSKSCAAYLLATSGAPREQARHQKAETQDHQACL